MKKYLLEFVVFMSGAVVMIFELAGSRVLAPHVGASLFVWTSLIGIILGSLSLGYYLGGKLADRKANDENLSTILLFTGLTIAAVTVIKEPALQLIVDTFQDVRWSSVTAAMLLFSIPGILMGMVSPYAVKLKIKTIETSGTTVGNLYAVSTVGSIVGTFTAGFLLIPLIGTTKILYLLAIIMLLMALAVYIKKWVGIKITVLLALLLFSVMGIQPSTTALIADRDTGYNRVWVIDRPDVGTGEPTRLMLVSGEPDSGILLNSTDLAFEYTKYYRLGGYFRPDVKNALMFGGAGYSYPKEFLQRFPASNLDVVEIDPGLTELARQYFGLQNDPRLHIYHEDGRTFLNNNRQTYDIFFGDAFKSSYSIPYQLTTIEATEKIYNLLSDNGIAIINIISAVTGDPGKFLRAEYATYKKVFPQVQVFLVQDMQNIDQPQNIMLVAFKSLAPVSFTDGAPEIQAFLSHRYSGTIVTDLPILTDEYAPVDYYTSKIIS